MELVDAMDAAWIQYERLEKRLIRYFDYVPPVESHYGVWSSELGEMLILAGTSLNSFLAEGLRCDQFNKYQRACNLRMVLDQGNDVKIGPLREVYEEFYALSQQPVFLLKTEHSVKDKQGVVPHFLQLAPFAAWAPTRAKPEGKSPEWWDVFTDLKHQRLAKVERATLKTVIDAVAGFFMVLAVHLGSIPMLSRFGVIHDSFGDKPLQHIIEQHLVKQRPRDANGFVRKVPVNIDRKFCVAETPLFGYAYPTEPERYKRWLTHPFRYAGPIAKQR